MWLSAHGLERPWARILAREAGSHELLAFVASEVLIGCSFITGFHLALLSPAGSLRFLGKAFFDECLPLTFLPFPQSFVVSSCIAGCRLALLRGCRNRQWCDVQAGHEERDNRNANRLRHTRLL